MGCEQARRDLDADLMQLAHGHLREILVVMARRQPEQGRLNARKGCLDRLRLSAQRIAGAGVREGMPATALIGALIGTPRRVGLRLGHRAPSRGHGWHGRRRDPRRLCGQALPMDDRRAGPAGGRERVAGH